MTTDFVGARLPTLIVRSNAAKRVEQLDLVRFSHLWIVATTPSDQWMRQLSRVAACM